MELNINREPITHSVKVSPVGGVVGPEALNLNRAVRALLEEGLVNVIIDFNRVDRVDDLGLSVLASLHIQAKALGGRARLFGLTGDVKQIAHNRCLQQVLKVCNTTADPDTASTAAAA